MYLDLDGFKRVNDQLGHDAGDRLLREVGYRLAGCVRQADIVSRLGGDEFAVLAEAVANPREQAAEGAERLIERIAQPIDIEGTTVHVGVSIGIETFGDDPAATVKAVVRHADHAMYVAKLAGRGVYRFYSEDAEEFTPQVR
jgi:diguanylate cyclase (GGDEF)-like protein